MKNSRILLVVVLVILMGCAGSKNVKNEELAPLGISGQILVVFNDDKNDQKVLYSFSEEDIYSEERNLEYEFINQFYGFKGIFSGDNDIYYIVNGQDTLRIGNTFSSDTEKFAERTVYDHDEYFFGAIGTDDYVLYGTSSGINKINLDGEKEKTNVLFNSPVPVHSVSASPSGDYLAWAGENNGNYEVNFTSWDGRPVEYSQETIIWSEEIPPHFFYEDRLPRVYFINETQFIFCVLDEENLLGFYKVDCQTKEIWAEHQLSILEEPREIKMSPDRRNILIQTIGQKLFLISVGAWEETEISDIPSRLYFYGKFTWAPDGQNFMVFYDDNEDWTDDYWDVIFYLYDLKGEKQFIDKFSMLEFGGNDIDGMIWMP